MAPNVNIFLVCQFPLVLKIICVVQARPNDMTHGNDITKSSRIPAKIEYGKHYVTRTFSPASAVSVSDPPPNKKRIRVRRIRRTTEKSITSIERTTLDVTTPSPTNTEQVTSRSRKYTTNWGRYTTNYKGASLPYKLILFPEVLKVKHNITKWWDPRHTEWFNYFTGHTLKTRWIPYTIRVYPLRALHTVYQMAIPGEMNKFIRNYGDPIVTTEPAHWVHRNFIEMEDQLSEGPPRAYRGVFWYEENNISCPHPVVTNTMTPYTGPPLIEFFDCDQFPHNYHYGFDDSQLYSEDAHLADKFGSIAKISSEMSESRDDGPRRLGAKAFDLKRMKNSEQNDFSVENLETIKNQTYLEILGKTNTTPADGLLTKVMRKTNRKGRFVSTRRWNTTAKRDTQYPDGGMDVRDTAEFEEMMAEYMNMDDRQDIQARKSRRRQIRTVCGQLISTIKRKLNTIWWKTFWRQTGTTPTTELFGKSTPWYRRLHTLLGDVPKMYSDEDSGGIEIV
uniref:Uncharacterized protein n=1 Tax=Cacopsylla melanoneura TaxID=428564 RepID=A0A8D8QNG5_9HEMI